MDITRKGFIGGAGMAIAGTAALGAASAAAKADEAGSGSWEPAWDDEADIVVVGYGGSGVVATIAGLDAGASVIALEKAPAREGGNMACSGGQLHEVSEDVDAWWDMYVHGSYGANADEETARAYIGFVNEMPDWFESHNIPVTWAETDGDGRKTPVKYLMGSIDGQEGTAGFYLFKGLDEAASARNADVRTGVAGKRLVQNPSTGEVVGVIAEDADGEQVAFKARKGVILACGGYENDPETIYNFFQPGARFYPGGTPYNTGDGLAMASAAGAAFWHMGLLEYSSMQFKLPSEAAGFGCGVRTGDSLSYLWVNRSGKRFCNERRSIIHSHPNIEEFGYDDRNYVFPNQPMFLVFDQTVFDSANPMWAPGSGYSRARQAARPDEPLPIEWPDNDAAVQNGWIFKGETVEELAAAIKAESLDGDIDGLDAEALAATVEAFNAAAEAGEDAEFGRPADKMAPLATPPFYAIEIANGVMNSNGGPRRNQYAQTLNAFGEPIPRLYNVGELGSFNALVYNFGNLLEACTTGRVAAETIAASDAWDA